MAVLTDLRGCVRNVSIGRQASVLAVLDIPARLSCVFLVRMQLVFASIEL
jgi:hypothetical protein